MSRHPESPWMHVLCTACYEECEPGRVAHHVIDAEPKACCRCGESASGMYYRAAPERFHATDHKEGPEPVTRAEAFLTGMICGTLAKRLDELGWHLDVPGYAEGDPAPLIVIRTPSGTELLVTVTETRTPPPPEP